MTFDQTATGSGLIFVVGAGDFSAPHLNFSHMDLNLVGFIPALLPVALSPGASFTLMMNSALARGPRGLLNTLAGTALGIYTHALLIGFGMTAVLVSSPAAYGLLKIVSIAWLLWLGSQLILSGCKAHNTESASAVAVTLQGAWLANVLNPKAIMFYLTVVTQFAGSDGGIAHYLLLASVHIMVMTVWLVGISYALVFSARKANSLMLKKYVNIAGGIMLIFFSLFSLFH